MEPSLTCRPAHSSCQDGIPTVTTAISGISGLGAAVAISPLPIMAVCLLLTTRRGRAMGLLFELGWAAGLTALGLIVLRVLGPSSSATEGTNHWRGWFEVGFGVALLILSLQQFRQRPDRGTLVAPPGWVTVLDRTSPPGALGLGALLAVANPKNGPLTVAASASIASAGVSFGAQVLALGVFVLIASVGVAVPLTVFLVVGNRASPRLARWRSWLTQHSAAVVAVLALVLGLSFLLGGVHRLS
jgi:threonine/homoserine/homoserine lactone efflux protein